MRFAWVASFLVLCAAWRGAAHASSAASIRELSRRSAASAAQRKRSSTKDAASTESEQNSGVATPEPTPRMDTNGNATSPAVPSPRRKRQRAASSGGATSSSGTAAGSGSDSAPGEGVAHAHRSSREGVHLAEVPAHRPEPVTSQCRSRRSRRAAAGWETRPTSRRNPPMPSVRGCIVRISQTRLSNLVLPNRRHHWTNAFRMLNETRTIILGLKLLSILQNQSYRYSS